jgi:hypothetical protein
MVYQITSSNIPTSSFSFPFNTNNYANYTTHSLTASNTGVTGSCTSSVNIQIAVCDIDQTGFFRSSVKETDIYNITSWFVTGSQNPSTNVTLSIINNTTAGSVYNGLLSGATAIYFGGSQNDTYTLTVRDTQIPLTCTFNYPIVAGLCSVVTSSLYVNEITLRGIGRWSTNLFLATDNVIVFGTPNEYNYGLARFFTGISPDNEIYRVRVYDPLDLGTVLDTQNFGNIYPPDSTTLYTTGTGTFLANVFGNYPLYEYFWYYGPTNIPQAPAGMPNIGGNVALFKVKYSQQYLNDNPQVQADNNGIYAETFFIDVFAVESSECTPKVSLRPPLVPDAGDFDGIDGDPCCFVANTLITLPDYTQIRIDNIKVGDTVLSYNEETGEILTSIVIKVSTPVKRDIVKHTLSNSIEIEAARNHPFWVVGKGWSSYAPSITKKDHDMDVEQLEQGDILLTQEGTEVVLVKMEFDENREYEVVYNIALDGHYTYYANSILVHNKTPEQVILCP